MTAEQIGLFGELDGLFAPELIPCTPPELVELIPGDHVAAMRGLESSPATAERIRAYEADRAERLAEIAQEHDEQQSPLDYTARTVQRDLEARLAGPRPGALF